MSNVLLVVKLKRPDKSSVKVLRKCIPLAFKICLSEPKLMFERSRELSFALSFYYVTIQKCHEKSFIAAYQSNGHFLCSGVVLLR